MEKQHLHWNPKIPRHGIGQNLTHIRHSTFFVSDLRKSVDFYSNIMKFKVLTMDKENGSATLSMKNMVLELKVGATTAFAGENLIVGHISVDVPDSKLAFDYLTQKKVDFEINVSVPKGIGKAESEGGSSDNTVGQAFIRDPDGYYLEICNCHLLTDFVLGLTNGQLLDGYQEGVQSVDTTYAASKLFVKAQLSKKKLKRFNSSSSDVVEPLPESDRPKEANPIILKNFIKRRAVYGDICQSFTEEQLGQILCEAGNCAATAVLLMKERIKKGDATKIYRPPAYYVGKVEETTKYSPVVLEAGADEKGKDMTAPAEMSAGVLHQKNASTAPAQGSDDKNEDEGEIPFEISAVNHIAFIVSDVGKSSTFYSDVLGLQQVKRPNFDRHGAWFTGGNVEIHLILGNPLAPPRSTRGLEANTTWFVVEDFDAAKSKLIELAADFGEDIQLEMSSASDEKKFLTCRDADGYVFGICTE